MELFESDLNIVNNKRRSCQIRSPEPQSSLNFKIPNKQTTLPNPLSNNLLNPNVEMGSNLREQRNSTYMNLEHIPEDRLKNPSSDNTNPYKSSVKNNSKNLKRLTCGSNFNRSNKFSKLSEVQFLDAKPNKIQPQPINEEKSQNSYNTLFFKLQNKQGAEENLNMNQMQNKQTINES